MSKYYELESELKSAEGLENKIDVIIKTLVFLLRTSESLDSFQDDIDNRLDDLENRRI